MTILTYSKVQVYANLYLQHAVDHPFIIAMRLHLLLPADLI